MRAPTLVTNPRRLASLETTWPNRYCTQRAPISSMPTLRASTPTPTVMRRQGRPRRGALTGATSYGRRAARASVVRIAARWPNGRPGDAPICAAAGGPRRTGAGPRAHGVSGGGAAEKEGRFAEDGEEADRHRDDDQQEGPGDGEGVVRQDPPQWVPAGRPGRIHHPRAAVEPRLSCRVEGHPQLDGRADPFEKDEERCVEGGEAPAMDPGGGGAQVTGDDRPEEVARGDVVAPTERGDERRERAHQGRDDAEPLIDQTPPREETEPARPEADPAPAVREAVARPAPQIGGRAPERIAVHDLDGRRDGVGHVEHAAAVRGEPVPRALVITAEHLVRFPEPVVEHV